MATPPQTDRYQEEHEEEDDEAMPSFGLPTSNSSSPRPGASSPAIGGISLDSGMGNRSMYHLPTSERLRGLANRILFSRYYIIFYLAMTGLSLGTVILSLVEGGCPSVTWHILEIIVNGGMVLEVGTRWIGFGKEYPLTPLNILDLVLTLFCVLTLLLVFLNPCGAGTKREEVLDTLLLVVRNGVQFWRLGSILRRSGHSLFRPPKPIDLTQARAADFDLDIEDEEAFSASHRGGAGVGGGAPRGGAYEELSSRQGETGTAFFDAADEVEAQPERVGVFGKGKGQVGYAEGRENLAEEDEAQWDRLG